jgi:hypothetical protein
MDVRAKPHSTSTLPRGNEPLVKVKVKFALSTHEGV